MVGIRPLMAFLISLLGLSALAVSALAAPDDVRISGPHEKGNLSIYFVHGPSQPGPAPLTLAEAITSGDAVVYETGQVSRLSIENKGASPVFVQAGDIVKGGRQDRVISVSLLLPPKSGRVPVGAFCVEQGRWRKRGGESVARFHAAKSVLPSKAAKLAMLQPRTPKAVRRVPTNRPRLEQNAYSRLRLQQRRGTPARDGATRQQRVWASVSAIQTDLSRNLKSKVRSQRSVSSLQLTLENKALHKDRRKLIDALSGKLAGKSDVIGFVFAVNGRINSGDTYPSAGLFRKMWPRLLAAAATEAIAARDEDAKPARCCGRQGIPGGGRAQQAGRQVAYDRPGARDAGRQGQGADGDDANERWKRHPSQLRRLLVLRT